MKATGIKETELNTTLSGGVPGTGVIAAVDPDAHLFDWTEKLGLLPAMSEPSGISIPGSKELQIIFRNELNHVQEIWRIGNDPMVSTDLTASVVPPAVGTRAIGTPQIGINEKNLTVMQLFRGTDNAVRSLYHLDINENIGEDNLSGAAVGAPKASADPAGCFEPDTNTTLVAYRGTDSHLHLISWVGENAAEYGGNLTAAVNAPKATPRPPCIFAAKGINNVIYRGVNGEILRIYWSNGGSTLESLSNVAGTPHAFSPPVAYYTPHNDAYQIVYTGIDGNVWELYWIGDAPVQGWQLGTVGTGLGLIFSSAPSAYYSRGTNTKHVIYRGGNGNLYELWWVPGTPGSPQQNNLTQAYGLPLATGNPAAFTVEGLNTQHVAFRGSDGHIYESRWK